jgi:hypothetical protein
VSVVSPATRRLRHRGATFPRVVRRRRAPGPRNNFLPVRCLLAGSPASEREGHRMSGTIKKRESHLLRGAVGDLALGTVTEDAYDGNVVTAVRDAHGHLRVQWWNINAGSGEIYPVTDVPGVGDRVTQVAVSTNTYNVITASVREDSGAVELVIWDRMRERQGHHLSRPATKVSLYADPSHGPDREDMRVFTVERYEAGQLRLISWSVSPDGKKITALAKALGNSIRSAVVVASDRRKLVTVERSEGKHVVLTPWDVSIDGKTLTPGKSVTGGPARGISGSWMLGGDDPQHVVTAVSDLDSNLRMTMWQLSDTGITQVAEQTFHNVGHIAVWGYGKHVVTAMANSQKNLEVRAWSWKSSATGGSFHVEGSIEDGPADLVAVTALPGESVDGADRINLVTASRNRDHGLELSTWQWLPTDD